MNGWNPPFPAKIHTHTFGKAFGETPKKEAKQTKLEAEMPQVVVAVSVSAATTAVN